jgi:hypothetical protein
MGLFIIICILLFVGVSSLISTGDIIEGNAKGLKAITRRGWTMIVLNLCIILFSVFQYYTNEHENKKKDFENIEKQEKRDSSLKAKYDSALFNIKKEFDKSNIHTISTISEVLGKYGYSLDSTNKTLVKLIRDSTKTKIITQDAPVLRLANDVGIQYNKHINGHQEFSLSVCSYDASSTDFDCLSYVLKEDSIGNISLISIARFLSKDLSMNKNQPLRMEFLISDTINFNRLVFAIRGTYKNMDKSRIYEINNLNFYDIKSNTYHQAAYGFKERIDKFLDQIKKRNSI